jgi:hypothetical protein
MRKRACLQFHHQKNTEDGIDIDNRLIIEKKLNLWLKYLFNVLTLFSIHNYHSLKNLFNHVLCVPFPLHSVFRY